MYAHLDVYACVRIMQMRYVYAHESVCISVRARVCELNIAWFRFGMHALVLSGPAAAASVDSSGLVRVWITCRLSLPPALFSSRRPALFSPCPSGSSLPKTWSKGRGRVGVATCVCVACVLYIRVYMIRFVCTKHVRFIYVCIMYVCTTYVCIIYVCIMYLCTVHVCFIYVCIIYVCAAHMCFIYVCIIYTRVLHMCTSQRQCASARQKMPIPVSKEDYTSVKRGLY